MVEIIPQKPKISLPTWRWPLWLSIALFFLSIAAFMFLKVYLAQIQAEIVNINNQIKTEAAKVNADDENTVAHLNDSLNVFGSLVSNHSYFSNVFDIIGSLTYQKVVFTKFDADRETELIQLKGTAQNYTALAKQMVALRENANVKNLEVKGISFSASGLEFELLASVEPRLFVKEQLFNPTISKIPEAPQKVPEVSEISPVSAGSFFESAWLGLKNLVLSAGSLFEGVWPGVKSLAQSLEDKIGDIIQKYK